jgi:uncharacterized protein
MSPFALPFIPADLTWRNVPLDWSASPDGILAVTAGPLTDTFTSPSTGIPQDNAPAALFTPPDPAFLLSAKVAVDFAADFDAGVLQVRAGEALWAKLCFEYSPQRQPMVVSVVTRGASDDCNHVVIDGREIYFRVAVTPRTVAFHYSHDATYWNFVRYFTLGQFDAVQAGFSSQSPRGQRCQAVFTDIRYRSGELRDLRNGE